MRTWLLHHWHWLELPILSLIFSGVSWLARVLWNVLQGSTDPFIGGAASLATGAVLGLVITLLKQIAWFKRSLGRLDDMVNRGRPIAFDAELDASAQILLGQLERYFVDNRCKPRGIAAESAVRTVVESLRSSDLLVFAVDDVRRYTELIYRISPPEGSVYATCFTDMDRFWCSPEIGPAFLEMNHRLKHDKGMQVERIVGVKSALWERREIKKREIIKLLTRTGLAPHIVLPDGRSVEDIFLVYDRDRNPVFGISWDVGEGGIPAKLVLRFDRDVIDEQKARSFDSLTADPTPKPIDVLSKDPMTLVDAQRNLRTLWGINTNSTAYLRLPDASGEFREPRRYWQGLEGTIVRPSPATLVALAQTVDRIKPRRCAILGCTPEIINVCLEAGADEVRCIDLSSEMYEEMVGVARDLGSANMDPLRFTEVNWSALSFRSELHGNYDLVVGIDVVNMVPHEQIKVLMSAAKSLLTSQGLFFLQFVSLNRTDEPCRNFLDKVNDVSRRSAEYMYDNAIEAGISDPHDIFFLSAMAYSGLADRIDLPAAICDLPDTFDKYCMVKPPEHDRTGFHGCVNEIRDTYEYCHSRLAIIAPERLNMYAQAANLDAGITLRAMPDGEKHFTNHMYTAEFASV